VKCTTLLQLKFDRLNVQPNIFFKQYIYNNHSNILLISQTGKISHYWHTRTPAHCNTNYT